MSEPRDLILEYLRALRSQGDRIEGGLRDLRDRVGQLEIGFANVQRDMAHLAETVSHMSVRLDRIDDRVARIERCLDLSAAPV